jgi:hypothetical protein
MKLFRHNPLPLLAATALLLAGCASTQVGVGATCIVIGGGTTLYNIGPIQPSENDKQLADGQRVVVLQASQGYLRVEAESGAQGYVAAENLAPAPPESAAPKTKIAGLGGPNGIPIGFLRGKKFGAIADNSLPPMPAEGALDADGTPLFDASDIPIPEGTDALTKPAFRAKLPTQRANTKVILRGGKTEDAQQRTKTFFRTGQSTPQSTPKPAPAPTPQPTETKPGFRF